MRKDAPSEELADAVRRVAAGRRFLNPELVAHALDAGTSPLTPRETDVLRAAAGGASTDQIGASLFLSPATVRNYLSNALTKLNARNRIDAIRIAREAGWISPLAHRRICDHLWGRARRIGDIRHRAPRTSSSGRPALNTAPCERMSHATEADITTTTSDPPAVRLVPTTNGPIEVTGPVELVDAAGRPIVPPAEQIYLCRCGRSTNKPFCDGSHARTGWTEA